MEPRSFKRGNQAINTSLPVATRLQWSHVLSNVETIEDLMGCLHNWQLQWSHVLSNVETSEISSRAESVIVMLQWSHVLSNVETLQDRPVRAEPIRASMEPRSFKRGNISTCAVPVSLKLCFNGATFFQTWKPGHKYFVTCRHEASMEPRSFKRGNLRNIQPGRIGYCDASMEPRSFKRGNWWWE